MESKEASELGMLSEKLGGRIPVRVHFLDNSVKTFLCDVTETFEDLRLKICQKLSIGDARRTTPFGVYECNDDVIGNCCPLSDSPASLVVTWGDENLKREQKKLVFMIRLFVPSLLNSMAEAIIHLRYIQAVFEVITGALPVTLEHAIRLAAIQLSVAMPHLNASGGAPPPGFLGDRVVEFVPCDMLMTRRADQWEQTIISRTWDLKDWSVRDLKVRYLELVSQSGRYGFKTFWSRQSKFPQLPEDVLVAAGSGGIRIWTEYDDQPAMEFEFAQLQRWGYDPGKLFYIEVNHGLKGGPLCAFQMNNGGQLAEILQDYALAMLQGEDVDGAEDPYQDVLPPEEDPADTVALTPPAPPPARPVKPPPKPSGEHGEAADADEAQAEADPAEEERKRAEGVRLVAEAEARVAREKAEAAAAASAAEAQLEAEAEAAASVGMEELFEAQGYDKELFTPADLKAAIFVQRHFRGYLVRLDLYKLELEFAATHLQSIARGYLHRKKQQKQP